MIGVEDVGVIPNSPESVTRIGRHGVRKQMLNGVISVHM